MTASVGNVLKYKGYYGSVEIDFEHDRLYGKLLFVKSLITYSGKNPAELKASFEEEVDDYLEDCQAMGIKPEKAFSGTFQIRCSPETHQNLAIAAQQQGISFNKYVSAKLESMS